MYKKATSFILLLFITVSCSSQNKEFSLSDAFKSREEYIAKDIPIPFIIHYSYFNKINRKIIIDTLSYNLTMNKNHLIDNFYIIEFQPDDLKYKLYGVLWSKEIIISYIWDNVTDEIKIINGEFLPMALPFKDDIESWNEYITNTSYIRSSFMGAKFVFGSNLKFTNGVFEIKNAVFREFNKRHFERYLKETPENDYKTIIIPN